MKKNTFWNNLFHRSEVKALKHNKEVSESLRDAAPAFLVSIKSAKTFAELLDLHKKVYSLGFTVNLGPGPRFRTKDIATMTLDDVCLGGIWGLVNQTATFWESYKDEPYGCNGFGIAESTSLYEMLLDQYKSLLLHNIKFMHSNAVKEIAVLNSLNY